MADLLRWSNDVKEIFKGLHTLTKWALYAMMHECASDVDILITHCELGLMMRHGWMNMWSFRTVAQALRWSKSIAWNMFNSYWWEHLSDCSIVLILLLEVIVWLLLVICYGLLVSSFAIVHLHLWVLEVLHAFLLLKWTMRSNCSNNCCLLCCSSSSHVL